MRDFLRPGPILCCRPAMHSLEDHPREHVNQRRNLACQKREGESALDGVPNSTYRQAQHALFPFSIVRPLRTNPLPRRSTLNAAEPNPDFHRGAPVKISRKLFPAFPGHNRPGGGFPFNSSRGVVTLNGPPGRKRKKTSPLDPPREELAPRPHSDQHPAPSPRCPGVAEMVKALHSFSPIRPRGPEFARRATGPETGPKGPSNRSRAPAPGPPYVASKVCAPRPELDRNFGGPPRLGRHEIPQLPNPAGGFWHGQASPAPAIKAT